MKYREALARFTQGKKDGAGWCSNTGQPLTTTKASSIMAIAEHTQDDNAARMELSRKANLEISRLAETAANICQDDDHPIFHGIMARIQTLSDIIFYAQRLHGKDEEDHPDTQSLQRYFKGML